MKKLFKSFGFVVVIAAIALNALLVTGCPDGGLPLDSQENGGGGGVQSNPSPSTDPPITSESGKYRAIELKANRWGTAGNYTGENWTSRNQIQLSDFTRIKLQKGNTYSFRIIGTSNVSLERVQIQLFSGTNNSNYLGASKENETTDLTNLGTDFDKVLDVKIENDPIASVPIILELNNIMWQTDNNGVQSYPEPNTSIPSNIAQDTLMATISNFSISLYDIAFATPPEQSTVEERWWSSVDSNSTATLSSYVTSDGICVAVVGGTAMPEVQNNWNSWRARVGYFYTAQANKTYSFKFEAWTGSGTRDLHLQYYEDNDKGIYLGPTIPITSTRTTYEVISESIPTSGIELLRFHLADKLGTVYIKIIEIKEYVFNGGILTVTNFSGAHGLIQNSCLEGSTAPDSNGIGLAFGSTVESQTWDWSEDVNEIHMVPKEIQIKSSTTIDIYVWEVNHNTKTFTPFKGTKTIPAGELELQQSHFNGANYAWTGDDYYTNTVPITFTNGNANINFGTQMEWVSSWDAITETYTTPYQITITGLTGKTGSVLLNLGTSLMSLASYASDISGNSVIFYMGKENSYGFTGNGLYYLSLNFVRIINGELYFGSGEDYVYTDGQSFASLGITSSDDLYSNLPKYTISSMPVTIDFSKFTKVPERQEWYDSSRITTITVTNTGITDYRGSDAILHGSYYDSYSLNSKFSSNDNSISYYFLNVESDNYILRFDFYNGNEWEQHVYTNGQTFTQLGITSESDLYSNLQIFPISSGGTYTIDFSKFKIVPKPYEWYENHKTITITGMNDPGELSLIGSSSYSKFPIYSTKIWNNNDTLTLTSYWVDFESDSNNYYLMLNSLYYNGSSMEQRAYVYTNGQTLAQLGITSASNLYSNLPKFTISSIPGTIDFSKFTRVPDAWLQ